MSCSATGRFGNFWIACDAQIWCAIWYNARHEAEDTLWHHELGGGRARVLLRGQHGLHPRPGGREDAGLPASEALRQVALVLDARVLLRRQLQGPLRRAVRADGDRQGSDAARELLPRPRVRLLDDSGRDGSGDRDLVLRERQEVGRLPDRQVRASCGLVFRDVGRESRRHDCRRAQRDPEQRPSASLRDHRRVRQLHERAGGVAPGRGVRRDLRA